MKTKFLITISLLLVAIMVFALIGCKDPGEGEPTDYDISFDDLGIEPTSSVKEGVTAVDSSKIIKLNNQDDELSDDRDVEED